MNKPTLLQALGQPLSLHASLVSMGLSPDRALQLITNRDLSFKPKYMSITETFRSQLKAIAISIDVNINALLNMLPVDRIEEAIENHKAFQWADPDCDSRDQSLTLSGITKDDHGKWWLAFEVYPFGGDECSYQLDDLDIQDVLTFLATIENIVDPTTKRTNEFISKETV